jgi:hypothetical protein
MSSKCPSLERSRRTPETGTEKRMDSMPEIMSAEQFVKELEAHRSPEELRKRQHGIALFGAIRQAGLGPNIQRYTRLGEL